MCNYSVNIHIATGTNFRNVKFYYLEMTSKELAAVCINRKVIWGMKLIRY